MGEYSFSVDFSKLGDKGLRRARRFLWGQDRPYRCRNKSHLKWRLTKKWFNRYRKSAYIGRYIVEDNHGNLYRSTDVRICKNGRTFDYKFTMTRLTN